MTPSPLTHAEMDELYELYVLRVLEPELAVQIDEHLRDGCEHCRARVDEALALTAQFAMQAPRVEPRAELRGRVLASIAPESKKVVAMAPPLQRPGPRGLYGLMAACAALLVGCLWLGYRNGQTADELAQAKRDRTTLEAALKSLSRSETRAVAFGKPDQPHGRVFVNAPSGVVFVASSLPKLPAGRTFQLWLIPPSGGPKSAGVFQADAEGNSVQLSPVTVDQGTKAVAVSVEPQSGSPAPTTTPIIVVPLAE